jgi:hypothetical protein
MVRVLRPLCDYQLCTFISLAVTHSNARRVADGEEVPAAAGDIALASSHGKTRVAEDAIEASVHIAQGLVAAATGRSAASPLVEGWELALDESYAGLVDTTVTLDEGGSFHGRHFGDGSTVDAHGDRREAREDRSETLKMSALAYFCSIWMMVGHTMMAPEEDT